MRAAGLMLLAVLFVSALPLRAGEPTQHWAYQPVVRPALHSAGDTAWARNPIDRFILAEQVRRGLTPSPPAKDYELFRRATFDLTGLPPTANEVSAFQTDRAPDAYERVVDRLFASPRYGERMATHWLDLARYADTHGYYVDSHRDMWRYRDEVIASFQRHQPFDQFTIEQLAGDLLPQATVEQRIASGFNRNHLVNFEFGAIPEEYRHEYVADRVATTATVWLGQTMDCARCHDHKHDPFSTRDYYSFYAFFNNVPEQGIDGRTGNAAPTMLAPTRAQQQELARCEAAVARLQQQIAQRAAQSKTAQEKWEATVRKNSTHHPLPAADLALYLPLDEDWAVDMAPAKLVGQPLWTTGAQRGGLAFDGELVLDTGRAIPRDTKYSFTLSCLLHATTSGPMTIASATDLAYHRRGWEWYIDEGRLHLALVSRWPEQAIVVRAKTPLVKGKWQAIAASYDGSGSASGIRLFAGGETLETDVIFDQLAGGGIASEVNIVLGKGAQEQQFRGRLDEFRLYTRALSSAEELRWLGEPYPPLELASIPATQRTQAQTAQLQKYFLETSDQEYPRLAKALAEYAEERRVVLSKVPTSMVMAELPTPRETFILERGNYAEPTDRVTANTPASLPPLPAGVRRDRLALARWLVDGQNPLTARVIVNRLWQLHFQYGLVRTPDDFGVHGEPPSHPQLLDWLAAELVESGWNLQHIQRLILTSATYRQASQLRDDLAAHDHDNRWLARFPRSRLPAEMIRDQVLATSGLLQEQCFGPSVFPYQPSGLWEEVSNTTTDFTAQKYSPSHGRDLYRRSLYTFWKRNAPAPTMMLFDAATRETCAAARTTTNTPLQALALWNDPIITESSRVLAERMLHATSPAIDSRIEYLFQHILGRSPSLRELAIVRHLFARQQGVYRADRDAAAKLIAVGELPRDTQHDPIEVAAWTIVAQTLFCTDEALSRN